MNNRGIGYVYIASNPSYQDNLVKIGSSNKPNIRMKQLYSTGVPEPFSIVYLLRCYDNTHEKVEKTIHDIFDSYRTNPKREFFSLPRRQMERLREVLEDKGDLVDEDDDLDDEDDDLDDEDDDLDDEDEYHGGGLTRHGYSMDGFVVEDEDDVNDFRTLFEQTKAKRVAKDILFH